ncbi:MAG: YcdB/YcdC domain-containing protein, partial [Candidatus Ornithomonoglobus sp.]
MKKTTALITAAAMLFGAAPAVWAAEADYEKLIPDIKNRMEIPAEYSDFKCTGISETDDGTEYQFKWSIPGDDTYKSVNLSCDSDGIITSYSNWQDSEEYDYLKTDIAAAKQTAERFAVRMNPALDGKLRIEADMSGYNRGAAFFLIYEEHNGIEYDMQIGGVSVASDGTVTNAYIDEPDFSDEDVSRLVTAAEAYNEYMEYAAPKLVYCAYTDKDENIKTFPAYIKGNRKAVSAVTGELI